MLEKLTVFRAISSYFARRMINRFTMIALVVFIVSFIFIWALAHYIDVWWWLFVIPLVILMLIFLIIRTIASFIARGLYNHKINSDQKTQIMSLVDKLERLIEQRQMTPPLLAIISVKDLIFHRELRTVKMIIEDTRTLKSDYEKLSKTLHLK
jgi:hypothetical protein